MKPLRGAVALAAVTVLVASCSTKSEPSKQPSAEPTGPTSSSGAGPTSSAGPAGPPEAAGTSLFSGAQPWTADVSAEQKSERSDAIIAALGNAGGWGNDNTFQIDFGIAVFTADASTPRMQVVGAEDYCFGGAPDCDPVPAEIPVPEGANIEGSADMTCDVSENDCHYQVIDTEGRKLHELYQATQDGENLTATGLFVWDLDKQYPDTLRGPQCTSADAAGFPITALTPTADEVASGDVGHALRFILPNDRMKADVYVPPATHAGGPESTDPDAPPYGVNFRLKQDFDDSSFNEAQKTVLAALKKYGMYLSDGGEIALTFADDKTSTAKWADLGIEPRSFGDIAVEDFEVIDHGPEVDVTYDCVRED